MSILVSAIAFIALLTFLILIHELGHFTAARWAKVRVEEFGFGLPPKIKTLFRQGGTIFTLNWVPFGGFVRLQGENAVSESARKAAGSFGRASIPERILILTAGVLMNFLFALVIFTLGFSFWKWVPTYLSVDDLRAAASKGEVMMTPNVLIDSLVAEGTAAGVALPVPSILTKIDGVAVSSPTEVPPLQVGKKQVKYTLLSGKDFSEESTITVPLKDGKAGVSLRFLPRNLSVPDRSVAQGFILALRESKVVMAQTVVGLAKLFFSLASQGRIPEGITSIVGIAMETHATVQAGFMMYLRLVALLSLTLAALNILPIPALDGGRLLFVLVEGIRRRPANRRLEMTAHTVGFIVLLALIVLITFNDIWKLF